VQDQETVSSRRSKGPSERLLKGMTQEEKDKFSSTYKRAKTPIQRINQYAAAEVARHSNLLDSPKGFEIANWAYLQAWYAGYRSAMRVTQELTRT
jgi:hypothetical protein